jgi:hypothetical protein
MRKRMVARMPRVPNKSSILRMFITETETDIKAKLKMESLLRNGSIRPAAPAGRGIGPN